MKTYHILISETLSGTLEVKARSIIQAENLARQLLEDTQLQLDNTNTSGYKIDDIMQINK